jgi:hypothetical protein
MRTSRGKFGRELPGKPRWGRTVIVSAFLLAAVFSPTAFAHPHPHGHWHGHMHMGRGGGGLGGILSSWPKINRQKGTRS